MAQTKERSFKHIRSLMEEVSTLKKKSAEAEKELLLAKRLGTTWSFCRLIIEK
jgi:hypothetical protein